MIKTSITGTMALAFLAGLATVTFAGSASPPGQPGASTDSGMSSAGAGSGSQSDAKIGRAHV